MQFLWRESCNFKIASVNQVRFSVRFVAVISQGFRTCSKLDATSARQKLHRVAATKIDGPLVVLPNGLFGDTAAILNCIVSNSYHGMLRGQMYTNLTTDHPIIAI